MSGTQGRESVPARPLWPGCSCSTRLRSPVACPECGQHHVGVGVNWGISKVATRSSVASRRQCCVRCCPQHPDDSTRQRSGVHAAWLFRMSAPARDALIAQVAVITTTRPGRMVPHGILSGGENPGSQDSTAVWPPRLVLRRSAPANDDSLPTCHCAVCAP